MWLHAVFVPGRAGATEGATRRLNQERKAQHVRPNEISAWPQAGRGERKTRSPNASEIACTQCRSPKVSKGSSVICRPPPA